MQQQEVGASTPSVRGDKRNVETRKGLSVRDLVTVAIFAVIYLIVFVLCASAGMIPIMAVLYPLPVALISGIPNVLFYTKARKFGMVTIMGSLVGLLIMIMGYGPHCFIGGVVCGLVADLIMRTGKYKSWIRMLFGHVVFSFWPMITSLQMWVMQEAYFESFRETQGDAFVNETLAYLSSEVFIGVLFGIVVCAVLGALLGKAILNKHFKRAGIA